MKTAEYIPSSRVSDQIQLSDVVYSAIDSPGTYEKPRHRSAALDCLSLLALSLDSTQYPGLAGDIAHGRLLYHLNQGGLDIAHDAYRPYSMYKQYAATLPDTRPKPYHVTQVALATLLGRYSDVPRATLDGAGEQETNSRHITHLTAIVVPYAMAEYPDLDPSLITTYSFVHDILEAYTGDTPTLNISDKDYSLKDLGDEQALEQFGREFSTTNPHLVKVVESYEELAKDEAKFVKSYDKLDPGFTHFANNGEALHALGVHTPEHFWREHDKTYRRMSKYALDFPSILSDRDERANMIVDVTWPQ